MPFVPSKYVAVPAEQGLWIIASRAEYDLAKLCNGVVSRVPGSSVYGSAAAALTGIRTLERRDRVQDNNRHRIQAAVPRLTRNEKITALVDSGICENRGEARTFLEDMGEL